MPAATSGIASGLVVDDASGVPLGGVPVRVDPWVAFPTPGPTPSPLLATVTGSDGRFSFRLTYGTYLLVIGDDAVQTPPPGFSTPAPGAADTPVPGLVPWRATVHDRVLFFGQEEVNAPVLPAQPSYTPPASELHGAYRLALIDPLTEAPCYFAYNADRAALGLPAAVADEWLLENSRAITGAAQNARGAAVSATFVTNGTGHSSNSGGSNCAQDTIGASTGPINFVGLSQSRDAQARWFAGAYVVYLSGTQSAGIAQFYVDPRLDAAQPWP